MGSKVGLGHAWRVKTSSDSLQVSLANSSAYCQEQRKFLLLNTFCIDGSVQINGRLPCYYQRVFQSST